eukprot:jgi/Chlat1/7992/Chrsp7S00629
MTSGHAMAAAVALPMAAAVTPARAAVAVSGAVADRLRPPRLLSAWLRRGVGRRRHGFAGVGTSSSLPTARHWLVARAQASEAAAASQEAESNGTPSPSSSDRIQVSARTAPHMWSGDAIRREFLRFYADRGHTVLPGSSLIPRDPTVLLTIAGMLQFKPVFLGQEPRPASRATTAQKCVRTNDVENVGRTARHHTFFEMLGNFSFGDYFKREAIPWAWELATKVYGLPADQIWVSVYKDDDEAYRIWRDDVGVPPEHIQRLGEEDNFWASGPTGPCGPCSELYYDFHPERGSKGASLEDDSRFIEFYNLVFMQYDRDSDGQLAPLAAQNIDTGMGLERMAQILQEVPNNYETDLIMPIIEAAARLANISYHSADERTKSALKVIGDHTRAVVYLISDGVVAANVGRGYVLRRLIRRVVRMARQIGISADGGVIAKIAEVAVESSSGIDQNVVQNQYKIYAELSREEERFVQTLERGEKLLEELLQNALASDKVIKGEDAFVLYDTYGFPVEITVEAAEERGVEVDMEGYEEALERARQLSLAAHTSVALQSGGPMSDLAMQLKPTDFLGYTQLRSEARILAVICEGWVTECVDQPGRAVEVGDQGLLQVVHEDGQSGIVAVDTVRKFGEGMYVHYGKVESGAVRMNGLALAKVDVDFRRRTRCHHTATHLLQSALRQVLGKDVAQAGSLVDHDRLRFDFSFTRPATSEELDTIESLVNEWITEGSKLRTYEMELEEAKAKGAMAMFGEKYSNVVRVIEVPGVSLELCGGTHVDNTSEIGAFRILSETGIASGVRRIEAVAGPAAVSLLRARDDAVRQLCSQLRARPDELPDRVAALQEEARTVAKELAAARAQLALTKADSLLEKAVSVGPMKVLVASMEGVNPDALKQAAERIAQRLGDPSVVLLGSAPEPAKVALVALCSPLAVKAGMNAGKMVGPVAKQCGGGGGGKPSFAQAGGKTPDALEDALASALASVQDALSTVAS